MGIEPLCWGTGSAAQGVGLCYPTSAQSEMNLLALAFHNGASLFYPAPSSAALTWFVLARRHAVRHVMGLSGFASTASSVDGIEQ
jgi:hypothetical protein